MLPIIQCCDDYYDIKMKMRLAMQNTNNFASFVYGCETWTITLRENAHKLKVLETFLLQREFEQLQN
jgi:hypothetical protein